MQVSAQTAQVVRAYMTTSGKYRMVLQHPRSHLLAKLLLLRVSEGDMGRDGGLSAAILFWAT